MNMSLNDLELKRNDLLNKLAKLGDLRRGTISTNFRKCGKKNCACAKPGHPGHGPQYLWSVTIKGKSFAKNLKMGPELEKYLKETDNYRHFIKLCDEIIEVNEKICNIRPTPVVDDADEIEVLKKKLLKHFMKKSTEK